MKGCSSEAVREVVGRARAGCSGGCGWFLTGDAEIGWDRVG